MDKYLITTSVRGESALPAVSAQIIRTLWSEQSTYGTYTAVYGACALAMAITSDIYSGEQKSPLSTNVKLKAEWSWCRYFNRCKLNGNNTRRSNSDTRWFSALLYGRAFINCVMLHLRQSLSSDLWYGQPVGDRLASCTRSITTGARKNQSSNYQENFQIWTFELFKAVHQHP